jgi:hypothetical protein
MASIDLPPELWPLIFEHATSIPGLFDVSPMSPIVDQPRVWLLYKTALHADIMKTKKAFVLVCRSWRNIAMRLLSEHIQIHRFETFKRFEDVLTLSPDHALSRSYTKRLDIFFDMPRKLPTLGEKRDYTVFNRIPSMFPNVRIFDFWIGFDFPDSCLGVLPKFDHLQSLSSRNSFLDVPFNIDRLLLRHPPSLIHLQALELEVCIPRVTHIGPVPHCGWCRSSNFIRCL